MGKPHGEFDVRADGGKRRTQCKPCRREYQNARNARTHPPRDRGPARVAGQTEPLRCTRCGELKAAADFPPVRRGEAKLQTWCRSCFAQVNARNYIPYYERERERITRRLRDHRDEIRQNLIAYLLDHPCVDCGEADIVVLEFDHVRDKLENVSSYANGGRSWELVAAEIAKCEVRCANCHRRKTVREQHARPSDETLPSILLGMRSPEAPLQLLLDDQLAMRGCRVCHLSKPLGEFPFRSAVEQRRHWICKPCQRAASRRWYAANRERHGAKQRDAHRRALGRATAFVKDHLAHHPCVDCGEADIQVLEFDHLRDKKAEVSVLVRGGRSIREIAAEIAKCEVRCANCHRRKTCTAIGSYRVVAEAI